LAHEYGPVYTLAPSLPFYNPPIVVVNRVDAANHILEKNGAATGDRPRIISAGEVLSGGMRVLLTPQGERFKKLRKALHSHLQPKSVAQYAPVQERYAKRLVLDVMSDPDGHQDHAKL
jgi:cytochrome P450